MLQEVGWVVGRNIRIDTRWSTGDAAGLHRDAAALVALGPDVILAGVGATIPALLQATRTVPIIFAQGIDPVGNNYVESLARPGGNATLRPTCPMSAYRASPPVIARNAAPSTRNPTRGFSNRKPLKLNMTIWNATIYCVLVVRDTVMVSLR
jgi:hypothetical protein